MSWNYTGDPANNPVDAVRLLIGDTDANDPQLADGEINYAITLYSANVFKAASVCAKMLGSKYSRLVDTSIDTVRVMNSQKMKHYQDLAETLDAESERAIGNQLGAFISGVSISGIEAQRENTDRVTPAFRNNLFNNLQAGNNNQDMDDDFDGN